MSIIKINNNNNQYSGKYVATSSFNDSKVIASGTDPHKVIKQAEKQCSSPVVFFVPKENAIHIY